MSYKVTIAEALLQGRERLLPASNSARLDAEVLLAHVIGIGRSALLAHGNDPITPDILLAYKELIERRVNGEPVAYLTGHREFFGLDFIITPEVLVPRPETESVVQTCLDRLPEGEVSQVADIGTGSGAILVSILAHRPLAHGFGIEIASGALEVAHLNCERLGVVDRATLLLGDLLEPLPVRVNVIAANLPYVSPGEAEPNVATWEPKVAVFGGGADGGDTIRRFLDQAPGYLLPRGTVVMETAYSQGKMVSQLAALAFPNAHVEVRKDLSGYDRIVVIETL